MKAIILCALLLVGLPAVLSDACNGDDYGTAGDFDFYVFVQEWPASFCSTHSSEPLCQNPTSYMTDHLCVHGLWPNYAQPQGKHDWPQCCQSVYGTSLNQTAINLLAAPMHQYWPDEAQQPGYNTSDFWAHEWAKHGTCSGLDQYTYFSTALGVAEGINTPSVISNGVGNSVALAALYQGYGTGVCDQSGSCMVSIGCDNSGNFDHVTTCWDAGTLTQMQCPNEVISDDSCPDPVNILSF